MILGYDQFDVEKLLATRGLEGWLEIATDDLEASASNRIAREIKSHFAEAVTSYMAEGQSEAAAHSAALADLGNPQKAAAKFRKTYLTNSETKWLLTTMQTASKPLFSIQALAYDVTALATLIIVAYMPRWTIPYVIAPFLYGLAHWAGDRLIPRLLYGNMSPKNFPRTIGLTGALSALASGLMIGFGNAIFVPSALWDPYLWMIAAGGSFAFGYFLNPGFRVWNKLRKMPDPWLDQPPQQAASS